MKAETQTDDSSSESGIEARGIDLSGVSLIYRVGACMDLKWMDLQGRCLYRFEMD